MKNKINLYLCGGGAINMYNKELNKIEDYGDGFADIAPFYLDTSDSNMLDKNNDAFFKFNKDDSANSQIDGSGGERSYNAKYILNGVDGFLNDFNIHKSDNSTFHIVAFTASGGSGAVIGPVLVKKLMELDLPVIVMMVGDSRSSIYTINTLNVIATLNNFALNANKLLNIIYRTNDIEVVAGDNVENVINIHMRNILTALAAFLSGEHVGIDNQDMVNMFTQTNYRTITVEPGLGGIDIMTNGYMLPTEHRLIGTRTIYSDENNKDFIVSVEDVASENGIKEVAPRVHHFKHAKITNENIVKLYNKNLPLHLYTYYGQFDKEEQDLKEMADTTYEVMESTVNKKISGSSRSTVTDDGLVF